jgi:hypothetical protein
MLELFFLKIFGLISVLESSMFDEASDLKLIFAGLRRFRFELELKPRGIFVLVDFDDSLLRN